jgi:NAD(P)-dependent dehydrogenase (short-subunit alcohol dehydrogenase family)
MTLSTPASPPASHVGALAGRAVLVTGAGPAGVAAARAFGSLGAAVALAGDDDLALLRTTRAIEATGGRAISLPGDIRDEDALRRVVASAAESFGALDFAVNTLGAVDGPRTDVDATCRAVYLAMRYELPAILDSGGGAIVNASAAPLGRHAEEGQCIVGLTRAAALDHMDGEVRVNAVLTSPGETSEFAAAALWLCSDRAGEVTGSAVSPRGRALSR